MDCVRVLGELSDLGWDQPRVAKRLKVSQSAVSRWATGEREPRGKSWESLRALAVDAGVISPSDAGRKIIRVVAEIGAGASIDPEFEQLDAEGTEVVDLPYDIPGNMIAFRVIGDSMSPTYEESELVVVDREQPYPVEDMVGLRAAVRVRVRGGESRRFLKRIARGSKPKRFNLESINARSATIVDAEIIWASPVRLVIPNVGIRKPQRHKRPAGPGRGSRS